MCEILLIVPLYAQFIFYEKTLQVIYLKVKLTSLGLNK